MFRNMSSEAGRQPSPRPGPREATGPGASRPGPAGETAQGAAELGRALGYDPDNPATWPGNALEALAGPAVAEPAVAEPADEDELTLTDARAMRALAHPLRMAIIELFSVRATLTATQASEALGESPANCAFHLRTLAKYGFVREAGGGRGRERPWTRVNRSLALTTRQPDPQAALAAGELGRLYLERWMERARRVYGSDSLPGWHEASGWSNNHVFMTAEEVVRLNTEVRRLLRGYQDRLANPALRPAGALPVEWTFFASPVPELSEPAGVPAPDGPAGGRQAVPGDPGTAGRAGPSAPGPGKRQ
jgi:hypothetical protein